MYRNIQELLKAARKEEYKTELTFVTNFYGSDLNPQLLTTQLQVPSETWQLSTEKSLAIADNQVFKEVITSPGELLSKICTVLNLLIIMPAMNAVSEQSFSVLHTVKTYLSSTMGQSCLNHLMVLHVHRELTDKLDLVSVANEFMSRSESERRSTWSFWTWWFALDFCE